MASGLGLHDGVVWDSVLERVLEQGFPASSGATRGGEAVSAVRLAGSALEAAEGNSDRNDVAAHRQDDKGRVALGFPA
ncbi:MAG: hypothetical protein ACQ9IQ_07965 [Nitrospirales bacterium]